MYKIQIKIGYFYDTLYYLPSIEYGTIDWFLVFQEMEKQMNEIQRTLLCVEDPFRTPISKSVSCGDR